MTFPPITPQQAVILRVIGRHWDENGFGPTVRGIVDQCGGGSVSNCHRNLTELHRRRYIEREPDTPRGITITAQGAEWLARWAKSGTPCKHDANLPSKSASGRYDTSTDPPS